MSKIKLYIFSLIAIVLIASSFFIVKVTKARSEIYSYDTTKSYMYDFNQSNANISDLDFKNGKFTLAKSDNANRSAFLKVNVESAFMGKYLQPSIELTTEKKSITQYFERGAKGIRYINISSLLVKGKVDIAFKENHVSINEQVQLISFKNQDIRKLKILVLAPHPDDAEIAAYGLYSDNNQAYVVTITAGDAGKFKYNEIYKNKIQHYLKKGELRTWDSITVPLLGGISAEHILNLGFFDLTLQKMFNDKSKEIGGFYTNALDINTYRKLNISKLSTSLSGNSSWNSFVENLTYLLKEIKPDIIVTPYPALDPHPDHKLTSVALFEAIKASGIRDGNLYLYLNHFVLNEYYPYGKEGGTISLPPHFEDKKIYFDGIYSHSLSDDKQKDKLFALEAMHDLRLDTEWRFSKSTIKFAWKQILRDIMGRDDSDYSYYRRFVRSNELFFVVKINNIYNKNILESLKGKL